MIGSLNLWLKIGALAAVMAAGFWVKHTYDQNQDLKEQNEIMELQIKKTAENVELLVEQLDKEIEYRKIAESALSNLANEVPDVVYSQKLPPEIQSVIDRFHDGIDR